jgi:hypothetical protein
MDRFLKEFRELADKGGVRQYSVSYISPAGKIEHHVKGDSYFQSHVLASSIRSTLSCLSDSLESESKKRQPRSARTPQGRQREKEEG